MGKKQYTREFLLSELRRFYDENGRSPTLRDMCKVNGYPGATTYRHEFGTFSDALQSADLELNHVVNYTKEILISEIHRFVKENSRVPILNDMKRSNGYPAGSIYNREFGSWNNAIEIAGYESYHSYKPTRQFLIDEIVRFYNEFGYIPTGDNIGDAGGYPSRDAYYTEFNSFTTALLEAGFEPNRYTGLTNDDLIKMLQDFYNMYGRSPTKNDLKNISNFPSEDTFSRRFGSWNNSLIAAGLPINELRNIDKDYLINEFKRAYIELGRIPLLSDMRVENGYPHYSTFYNYFDSYEDILTTAGFSFEDIYEAKRIELSAQIINAYEKLGRVPKQSDMTENNGYCSPSTFSKYFGSWNNALEDSGLIINVMHYKYDGSECCGICGTTKTYRWNRIGSNIVCSTCYSRNWRQNNPEIVKDIKRRKDAERKNYGFSPLNKYFKGSHAHHLWLEDNKDLTIYLPGFLHLLHMHDHNKPETLYTPNAIALDYLINEDLYNELYFE